MRKAIILAGGQGTRLYPVTLEIPKPLLTIKRKPIATHLVELFRDHGVKEVRLIIRPQDRDEFEWWRKRWSDAMAGVEVGFEEETKPMGTIGYWAHVLRNWTKDEPFFLTNGDELKGVDLTAMAAHHNKTGGLATIALVEVPNPQEYGVAVLEGDMIVQFLEKPQNPPTNLINSGLYIVDPAVIRYLKPTLSQAEGRNLESAEKFLMIEKDLFPYLAQDKKLAAYKAAGQWFDCGNLQRWEKAIKEWGA